MPLTPQALASQRPARADTGRAERNPVKTCDQLRPPARPSVIKKSANRIKILLRSKIIGLRHQKKAGIFRQHTDPVFPAPRSSASMSRFLTSIEDVKQG